MVALRGQLDLVETRFTEKSGVVGRIVRGDLTFFVGASGVYKSVRDKGLRSDGIPNRDVLGE